MEKLVIHIDDSDDGDDTESESLTDVPDEQQTARLFIQNNWAAIMEEVLRLLTEDQKKELIKDRKIAAYTEILADQRQRNQELREMNQLMGSFKDLSVKVEELQYENAAQSEVIESWREGFTPVTDDGVRLFPYLQHRSSHKDIAQLIKHHRTLLDRYSTAAKVTHQQDKYDTAEAKVADLTKKYKKLGKKLLKSYDYSYAMKVLLDECKKNEAVDVNRKAEMDRLRIEEETLRKRRKLVNVGLQAAEIDMILRQSTHGSDDTDDDDYAPGLDEN
jgi:hypothetical protein